MLENQGKACSFFGHRKIEINEELKQKVKDCIENLIINHNVSIFLFGSRSNFNNLCHLIVTGLKEKYPNIKRVAYTCKSESCVLENDRERLEQMYLRVRNEEVSLLGVEEEFEHKTKYISGRASYIERNKAMINASEYCIFYYDENYKPEMRKRSKKDFSSYQPNSGTKIAYIYAKQKNKIVINII
ncbi:MAG: DUF1273 family protein [Clostridia bacterium]|nr:DUF1273 family protein [Clostridia bacterium]